MKLCLYSAFPEPLSPRDLSPQGGDGLPRPCFASQRPPCRAGGGAAAGRGAGTAGRPVGAGLRGASGSTLCGQQPEAFHGVFHPGPRVPRLERAGRSSAWAQTQRRTLRGRWAAPLASAGWGPVGAGQPVAPEAGLLRRPRGLHLQARALGLACCVGLKR